MTNKTISIIILSYNSGEKIEVFYDSIKKRLKLEKIDHEIIIIDDGSCDDSFDYATKLEKKDKQVQSFQLSKNYTSHYSIFAGFTKASGGCAIALPDDFQVPIDTVISMYRLWEKGNKVIIPYRNTRDDSFFTRMSSTLYYLSMNLLSEVKFPKGGADVFLADREIIEIFNKHIHPKNTSTIIEVLRLGFDPLFVPMRRPKGINSQSRWSFSKKIRLALDTFFSSSSFPIKFISTLGIGSFFLSICLIIYYIAARLYGVINIPGWTLLVITITFFSGLILLSLGIISEYIWRIFEEVKGRPGYIIRDKEEKK